MAATNMDGPVFVYGDLAYLTAPPLGSPVPDPNSDAGPSVAYQGGAIPDPRLFFNKDKVTGYTGTVQAFIESPMLQSVNQIPFTAGTANVAALANVTNGTAMTLASASSGITVNIPYRLFSAQLNGNAPTTIPIMFDLGFAFGNVTSGSTTVPVADGTKFFAGMPLVIAGVGNAGGTVPLLTLCTAVSGNNITIANAPLATLNPAPIGTGDIWGPSENGFPTPQAHYPFLAGGPGLFLDPRQAITRCVSITGVSGGAGGAFTVVGIDIYGQQCTQTITAGAGVNTVYGKKALKGVISVTPGFTDAHNYSVGTSDMFGMHFRSVTWEEADVSWNGSYMTSSTGWIAYDGTNPATAATGDPRGTIQTATANGSGTGIGTNASNGSVSSLAMTGRRLFIAQSVGTADSTQYGLGNNIYLMGVTQV